MKHTRYVAAGTGLVAVLIGLALVLPALAAPSHPTRSASHPSTSNFAREHPRPVRTKLTSASSSNFKFSCGQPTGNRIIDVTENIINDVDSGEGGNYWAFDTVTRKIQVWNIGPDEYCAAVSYAPDSFQAVAGQESPGTGGTLTGDEYGSFNGGYVTTSFTATLDIANPTVWPANGKVNGGTAIDYQCDITGNCPGYVDWTAQYFSGGVSLNLLQWGWIYHGKDSQDASSTGTWVNSSTGNSGDILDHD
jgi:hypothetical protein